jgi:predicted DNA-binding transcriptional regulator AlpA
MDMEKIREPFIRMDKVVELTGFSQSNIYKLVYLKKIPCYKPTRGRLFFKESEILDFIDRCRQAADYEVSERANAILNGEAK